MTTDEYERKYMDAGDVSYREKYVARIFAGAFLVVAAMIAALGVFVTVTALLQGAGSGALAGLVPIATASLIGFIGLYFAVMRTTVSRTHLVVTWGTMGRTIPLAAISDVRFEDRIGLGPKYDGRGWVYGPMGTRRGVRVEWSEGGKTQSCYVGSRDPSALMQAIQAARAGKPTRVDVGVTSDVRDVSDAETPAVASSTDVDRV
jgi:hypothetical protein